MFYDKEKLASPPKTKCDQFSLLPSLVFYGYTSYFMTFGYFDYPTNICDTLMP